MDELIDRIIMVNPPPENLDRYNSYLNELLSGQGGSGYPLPPLMREKGRLDELFDQIKSWFDRHSQGHSGSDAMDLTGFFILLKWLLIAAVSGLFLFLIIYLVLHFSRRSASLVPQAKKTPNASLQDLDSIIEQKIQAALNSGEFAKAGRLRWKLFLKRLDQNLSLTPWEFEKGGGPKQDLEVRVSESRYLLMFGKRPQQIDDYRVFDRSLQELEKNRYPHAA
jgi:hypothetical protein